MDRQFRMRTRSSSSSGSTTNSTTDKFSVFGFNQEDERVEKDSKKMLRKYQQFPNLYPPKYASLHFCTEETKTGKDTRNQPSKVATGKDAIHGVDNITSSGAIHQPKPEQGFGGFDVDAEFRIVKSCEDVIYPKGDPDAVSISKRDIQLLQPRTFVNDTIIDFYIKYLKNKVNPEDKHRFHFFNSFFFRKLANLGKHSFRACESGADLKQVCKWTRKLDIFDRDYIFIPVNFRCHWSLIIICHPGEVPRMTGRMETAPKVPCILHMDSVKGSHRGIKTLIRSYLWEEWKERHTETEQDISSNFLNLPFHCLEVPQQENLHDCGLFLLHYVELFLQQAPVNFNFFRINNLTNFLNEHWFRPADVSPKRAFIERLIYKIAEDDYQNFTAYSESNSLELPHVQGDNNVDFLQDICNSCHSNAVKAMESTSEAVVPSRDVQDVEKLETFYHKLEPRDTTEFPAHGFYKPSAQRFENFLSPIEEVEEGGEKTASLLRRKAGCKQMAKVTECLPVYSVKDARSLAKQSVQRILVDLEGKEKERSSSQTPINESLTSLEAQIEKFHPLEEFIGSNHEEEDESGYSLTLGEGLAARIVEDSEETNCSCELDGGKNFALSCQGADSAENIDMKANTMPSVSQLRKPLSAKRQRLACVEGERRVTRSLFRTVH